MIPDLPEVNGPEVSKWIGSSVWSRDMGRDDCEGIPIYMYRGARIGDSSGPCNENL